MYEGRPSDPVVFQGDQNMPERFASELEFGDQILAAGDFVFADEDRSADDLPKTPRVNYTIVRDGTEMIVEGPALTPPRISGVFPRSAADDADIKINDVIIGINGTEIWSFDDIVDAVNADPEAALDLDVWRGGETLSLSLTPRRVDSPTADGSFETRYLIGIEGTRFYEQAREGVGFFEAITSGASQLWWRMTTSIKGLWYIIVGDISTCNLNGPVAIAQASGSMAEQGAENFILFIGMLSAAVGLLNLFPIPILDGGHLVFHAYEAVFRRPPNERAMQVLMALGLSIIGTMMIFALANDLFLCP